MKKTLLTFIFILSVNHLFAQQDSIQNGGFEFWGTNPFYDEPENWTTLNPLAQIFGVELAFRTTDSQEINSGTSAIKLETKNIPGIGDTPSILTNGVINTSSQTVEGGTGVSSRPVSFHFSYRFDPIGTDSANVTVEFTKWNAATNTVDLIGDLGATILSTQGMWKDTVIQVSYVSSETPDSVLVLFNTGAPPNVSVGTALYLDDISYSYSGVGIRSIEEVGLEVYPNPVSEILRVSSKSGVSVNAYQIYAVDGRKVSEGALRNMVNEISVAELKKGYYTIVVATENGRASYHFVKQ